MADNTLHPNRRHPQAMGQFLTAAQLRERWGLPNNNYLEALAGTGELVPSKHGMPIQTRKKGWSYEFGIPPELEKHDTDPATSKVRIYDANLVEWMGTLPDDVEYALPFVLEHESFNPQLKLTPAGYDPENIGSGHFGLPADGDELKDALRLDAWTWAEALCWCKGRRYEGGYDESRPRDHFLLTYYPDEADQIQRAIKAGKLTVDSSTPRQWLEWALAKGWSIPGTLLSDGGVIDLHRFGLTLEQANSYPGKRSPFGVALRNWFDDFALLIEKGLPLYSPDGERPLLPSTAQALLADIQQVDGHRDDVGRAMYRARVSVPSDAGNKEIQAGALLVYRDAVRALYAKLGVSEYPWPVDNDLWPSEPGHIEFYPLQTVNPGAALTTQPTSITATVRPPAPASSATAEVRASAPAASKGQADTGKSENRRQTPDTRTHIQNRYLWQVRTRLSTKLKREPKPAEVQAEIERTWVEDNEIDGVTDGVIDWAHTKRHFNMRTSLASKLSQLKKNPPNLS